MPLISNDFWRECVRASSFQSQIETDTIIMNYHNVSKDKQEIFLKEKWGIIYDKLYRRPE